MISDVGDYSHGDFKPFQQKYPPPDDSQLQAVSEKFPTHYSHGNFKYGDTAGKTGTELWNPIFSTTPFNEIQSIYDFALQMNGSTCWMSSARCQP